MTDIGVVGMTISHAAGSPISGGTFTITSSPSTKCKATGKFIYRGTVSFNFTGGNASGIVPGSISCTGTISPTATKVKADGSFCILEGDTGSMSGTGTSQSSGNPIVPVSGSVEISDAGQNKARGV